MNDSNAKFRQIACRTGLNARRGPLVFAILTSFKKIARKFHIKSIYDDVTEFIIKVTNDTIEYRRQNNLQQNDFLELMMRIKDIDDKEKSLTFNEIAGQVYLFFAAGHDSTTIALTFTLYQVAKHPEVQAKARDIIETVFEKYNGQLTYEMMSDLPYIDQIVEGESDFDFIIRCQIFNIFILFKNFNFFCHCRIIANVPDTVYRTKGKKCLCHSRYGYCAR